MMIASAGLMAATGLAFPQVEHLFLIALVAFVGTINPSGGDLGVLVPLEHAVLARSATDAKRTHVFARYSLIGALSAAAGSLAASLPDFLVSTGRPMLSAFRLMFYAYAVLEAEVELTPVAAAPDDATVDELVAYYRDAVGEHATWDEYRASMVTDRRVIVRFKPNRAYGML